MERKTLFRCVTILFALLAAAAAPAEPALRFTGNGSYIEIGARDALQIPSNTPFTIEGWIWFNTLNAERTFYSKNTATRTSPYTYMFGVLGNNRLSAYTGAGGSPVNTWRSVTLSPLLAAGRWYHLAFSFDGANIVAYLDGVPKGTNAYSFGNNTAHTVKLGGYQPRTDIDGLLREVRVWNRARSGAEIAAERYRSLTGAEEGLIGYWPLSEGAGAQAFDATANSSTGTIINASWVDWNTLGLVPAGAGFEPAAPFLLADPLTGSTRFTGSNEVVLAAFPVPEGYDRVQITASGEPAALNPANWIDADAAPAKLTFARPGSDAGIARYAWFTNSLESVPLRRGAASILYTAAAPQPVIQPSLMRLNESVTIKPVDLDAGSTGGTAGGLAIPIVSRSVVWVSGPQDDQVDGDADVTVAQPGVYTLRLRVVNEAGKAAVSEEVCTLTVPASMTILPVEDNSIAYDTPDTVVGSGGTSEALSLRGQNAAANGSKIYLRFDLTGLPYRSKGMATVVIHNRTGGASYAGTPLNMWILNPGFVPAPGVLGIDWTEDTLTWNNAPGNLLNSSRAFSSTDATLVFTYNVPSSVAVGDAFSFTIPRLGDWIQPDGSITVMIAQNSQKNGGTFYSKETTLTARRPKLIFEKVANGTSLIIR